MYKKLKTVSLLFICLMCFNLLTAQQKATKFKTLMDKSYKMSYTESDSLSCDISNEENLARLLVKNDWKISDLIVIDCLLQKTSQKPDHPLNGLIYYIGGRAYNKFDVDKKLSLYQTAYVYFNNVNDEEGKFFSLTQLFNSKIKSTELSNPLSKSDLSKLYKEIAQIALKTDYVPVKLSLYESQLRKKISLDEPISETTLDNLTDYGELHSATYPDTAMSLFNVLGIAYQQNKKTNVAQENLQKFNNQVKTPQYDYVSYLLNLGRSHCFNQNIDSARYYFKKSYDLIPKESSTINMLEQKSLAEYNLGIVYKELKNMDSAYYFMRQSLESKNKLSDLQLDINRTYAEKKFENKKNELRLSKIDNELLERKRIQAYLFTFLLLAAIVIAVLFIFNEKTKRIQSAKIAKDRERLFRIINHDLNSPLQVFATTARLLPKLIAKKKFDEVEKIQDSLCLTSIALQNTLNNLFAWSDKMKSEPNQEGLEKTNITQEIEGAVATYTDLAKNREIKIQTQLTPNLKVNTISMKLGNLVRNLIYNAVQHGETQSIIYIELKEIDEKRFQFSCKNRVSSAELEKVQNLVSLMNSNEKRDYSNLGLGMVLIFDAIVNLNGTIEGKLEGQELHIFCKLPK